MEQITSSEVSAYYLEESAQPDPDLRDFLIQQVRHYNTEQAGDGQAQPLAVVMKDRQGQIVAGMAGRSIYQHLIIEVMWVAPQCRRLGLGRQVMLRAEQLARQRGCVATQVDTLSFQGPAFYASLGFSVVGEIDQFPPGHKRYFLLKKY